VRTTHIAAPVESVFAFFAQPQNLALLTPPRMRFRVVRGPDRSLREGDRIEYAMRMHGIPVRWSSRIVSWRENESFADLQERGPFQRWLHTHRFASTPEGTEMRDEVEYDLPLGIAGIRRHAQPDLRPVFLDRIEAELRELGGLAEQQRQQARGERIERAGMACLVRVQQAFHRLQDRARARADRLVEQQYAIELQAPHAPSRSSAE